MDPVTTGAAAGGVGAAAIGLAQLAKTPLAQEIYKDGVKKPLKKASDLVASALGTIGKLVEVASERTIAAFAEAEEMVPAERRVEPPPEIVGPAVMDMVFLDDDSLARKMFIRLLARAMDKERQNEAHPAFVRVIEQLSPDEALIMKYAERREKGTFGMEFVTSTEDNWIKYQSYARGSRIVLNLIDGEFESMTIPAGEHADPKHFFLHVQHLIALNLVELIFVQYHVPTEGPNKTFLRYALVPTEFGDVFRSACVLN